MDTMEELDIISYVPGKEVEQKGITTTIVNKKKGGN